MKTTSDKNTQSTRRLSVTLDHKRIDAVYEQRGVLSNYCRPVVVLQCTRKSERGRPYEEKAIAILCIVQAFYNFSMRQTIGFVKNAALEAGVEIHLLEQIHLGPS